MIGFLRGVLVHKLPPHLLIDVQGVGYEVEAPLSSFGSLPEVGAEVKLYTHLAVRDDAHALYGFRSGEERALFRSLIRISGVGAKLALVVLSGFSTEALARCVHEGDEAALASLPGIGRKTAQRLVIELRDRLPDVGLGAGLPAEIGAPERLSDAINALIALGYKIPEATRMIRAVDRPERSSEELIRTALRVAGR